jgi:hypothetical protein
MNFLNKSKLFSLLGVKIAGDIYNFARDVV